MHLGAKAITRGEALGKILHDETRVQIVTATEARISRNRVEARAHVIMIERVEPRPICGETRIMESGVGRRGGRRRKHGVSSAAVAIAAGPMEDESPAYGAFLGVTGVQAKFGALLKTAEVNDRQG